MLSTSASSVSYRQKGKLPSANSKLYKGFVHDATSKLSVGSIPAKLELIIYRDQSTRAFGSSEPRFKDAPTENPGPQDYEPSWLGQQGSKSQESISKKGFGGLATSQERQVFAQKYVNTGPGPCTYSQNQSFTTAGSTQPSFFMRQQQQKSTPKTEVVNPGPGEYELPMQQKTNVVKSVFNSKTGRDKFQKKPAYPPPGAYNVQTQISKPVHIGPTSSFYPDNAALKDPTAQQQIVQMLLNDNDKPNEKYIPGPGEYEVKFPDFDPDYIRTKQLSSFVKVKDKDRFGNSPEKQPPENLGPGHYERQSQFDKITEAKTMVSGAVFMSESLRKPFGDFDQRLGPNPKIPYLLPKKKTYHLNLQRKWV